MIKRKLTICEEFSLPQGFNYFRISSTNSKNLQILTITLIYDVSTAGTTDLFTVLEQAEAYVNYFSQQTRAACLVESVPLSLWNELKAEFNYLNNEVKSMVKDLVNTTLDDTNSPLLDRYRIIVNKYHLNDYIGLTPFNENSGEMHNIPTNLAFLIISFGLFLVIPFYFLKKRKDK